MVDLHRLARNLAFFAIGFLLSAVPMLVFAGTYPASPVYLRDSSSVEYASAEAACKGFTLTGFTFKAAQTSDGKTYNCIWSSTSNPNYMYGGAYKVLRCLNGGTLSGQTCTKSCTAPEVLNSDGSCGIPAPTCPGAGTSGPASGQSFSGQGSAPSNICSAGCLYNTNIAVGIGGMWSATAGASTGSTCTTNTSSGTPPEDPKTKCVQQGMAFGTVNGQVVCVKPDSSTSSSTNTKTPDPTKPDAGTGSTTNTTTNTSCTNGSCNTTTTTTTTTGGTGPGGTGPGSSTTTDKTEDKKPQAQFCEENPSSPFCKSGSFSGSCSPGAEPSCDGDAIQCAQARAAWKLQCDLSREPDDAAYKLGKSLVEGNPDPKGNPLDPSKVTEINVGTIVSQAASQRTLSGQCIRSPSFSALGKTFTLDVSLFCQFASIVGYLMVAVSSVIAIRMISA